jgi:hypothetical protein
MGDGKKCVFELGKFLGGFDFYYMDPMSHSRGLVSA